MIAFILIATILLYIFWRPFRLTMQHPIQTAKYAIYDTVTHFKYKEYNRIRTGELVAYCGLFGKGKTLSAVNKVVSLYRRYNDALVWDKERLEFVPTKIKIISNVELTSVPYERFVSLAQVVAAAENNMQLDRENGTMTATIVLGDEFSVQLNSRKFKENIDPLFLNTILTCRHHHISLYYTAQRFGHVDALLRQVTSYVVDCRKSWRFQLHDYYDAWEMENATNPQMLTTIGKSGFFVTNADYDAYDTLACVGNLSKSCAEGDMLSPDEIIALQQNTGVNMDAVLKPSRKYVRSRKRQK